jgi:capsid protein
LPGNIPLPKGVDSSAFYDPVMREALTHGTWIGAARGQIDEMKETQSAILRIKAGLSTYEAECARLGDDFRRVFEQQAREQRLAKELGLTLDLSGNAKGNAPQQGKGDKNADARPGDPEEDEEL